MALLSSFVSGVLAQRDLDAVQIEVLDVAEGVYMLTGAGGNIGVSVGDDGVFLVDDQFAPLTEKILAAIATLTEHPVKFVVNTHFHGDHVGGNENLGKAGAIIIAHENVRTRMSVEQFRSSMEMVIPAAPPGALPVITFTEGLNFHWNGEQIRVFHVGDGGAHTDGDAIIQFVGANAFHMGDIYFNGMYPFIDLDGGGDVHGLISAVNQVLALSNEDTKVIPGHGPLSNKAELEAYRDLLQDITHAVQAGIDSGLDLAAIIAQEPTAAYDAAWGGGFISNEAIIGAIYGSLSRR